MDGIQHMQKNAEDHTIFFWITRGKRGQNLVREGGRLWYSFVRTYQETQETASDLCKAWEDSTNLRKRECG